MGSKIEKSRKLCQTRTGESILDEKLSENWNKYSRNVIFSRQRVYNIRILLSERYKYGVQYKTMNNPSELFEKVMKKMIISWYFLIKW